MTNLPDDLVDPAEGRLIRSVRALTEPAVVPIDALAIAASAARPTAGVAHRIRSFSPGGGRLGWLLAGVAITAVLAGGAIGAGAFNGLLAPKLPADQATPTAVPGALADCDPRDLEAIIGGWEGAAGHRIASVRLDNVGSTSCSVPAAVELSLVDAGGMVLIAGEVTANPAISIAPNGVLHTLVQVGNYCGPTPREPATIVFAFGPGLGSVTATPAWGGIGNPPSGVSGIPPCLGTAGPTDDITMHPWSAGPAS